MDSRLNELELTLLELEVDSKSDYADPVMPVDYTVNSNETDLSNLTNSFTGKFSPKYSDSPSRQYRVFKIITTTYFR